MNGIYKVTFEVECCEDKIYKYLNHKRWGKNQQDNDVEKFAIVFAKRHINAGFDRVKLPLDPHQRSLDWCFKWYPKASQTCEIVRIGETDPLGSAAK